VDVGVGDVLTYEVDFAIPFDIKDTAYTNIKLTDTLKGANIVEGSVKVFQGNTELTDSLKPVKDTNLTYGGTGDTLFTLSYDLTKTAVKDDMSNYPGKTLTVQYKVEVTNEMFGDDEAQNKAVLNVNSPSGESSQEDTSIPFTPGGLTGIKVGATEDSKPLQGAKFALYRLDENGKKQYASFDVNGLPNPKTITWGESGGQMDATSRLTSGEDGTVSISGLKYGTYYLEETKAPNGFILPKEEDRSQSIVVSEGTYTQAVAEMEKIYNVPEAEGELPLTGGIGVLTLIAVGGTIMVMTTLRKKKED
jgi:fimbrial isopeptide formation D2 family protein